MIKPIRPPYRVISFVLLAVVGGILGTVVWQIRRSPDYYERRGDRLFDRGECLLAARQFAAAIKRTDSSRGQALLLLKTGRALGHSKRTDTVEALADTFEGAQTLSRAFARSPQSYQPAQAVLQLHFYQAALIDSREAWDRFRILVEDVRQKAPDNQALVRYGPLVRFHTMRLKAESPAQTLRDCLSVLDNAAQSMPADPDLIRCRRLAQLALAEAIADSAPGEAYALRSEATAEPDVQHDGRDKLRNGDMAAVLLLANLIKEPLTNTRFARREAEFFAHLESAPGGACGFRAATALLKGAQLLPADRLTSPARGVKDVALDLLEKLWKQGYRQAYCGYVLLRENRTCANGPKRLEVAYSASALRDNANGLLDRSVEWLFRVAAGRERLRHLFENMETDRDVRTRSSCLSEIKDELRHLTRLENLKGALSPFTVTSRALVFKYDGELRRALTTLLHANELSAGREPSIALEIGDVLVDLGENGAAIEWLERSIKAERMLSSGDRDRARTLLLDACMTGGMDAKALKYAETWSEAEGTQPNLLIAAAEVMGKVAVSHSRTGHAGAAEMRVKAIRLLEHISQEHAPAPGALYRLGVLYAQSGEHAAARACLRKVLETDRFHTAALGQLIELLVVLPEDRASVQKMVLEHECQARDPRVADRFRTLAGSPSPSASDLSAALTLIKDTTIGQQIALHRHLVDSGLCLQAQELLADLLSARPNHELVLRAKADELIAKGDYAGVSMLTDTVANPHAVNALMHQLRGRLDLLMGQPYSAAKELNRALRTDPINSETLSLLGQSQSQSMLHQEAVESFRKAMQIRPADINIQLALHRALKAGHRDQEAAEVLRRITLKQDSGPDLLFKYLQFETALGRDESVIRARRQIAGQNPANEGNLRELAGLLYRAGNGQQAREILERLVQDGSQKVDNILAMAGIVEEESGRKSALAYLDEMLAPKYIDAITAAEALAAARQLERLGAADRAGPLFAKAAEAGENAGGDAAGQLAYIRWLVNAGELEKAVYRSKQMIGINALPAIWAAVGNIFLSAGHPTQVKEVLHGAPETVETLALLARAEFAAGNASDGNSVFKRAIAISPTDPRPYIWRAQSCLDAHVPDAQKKAEIDLRRAISLAPQLAETRILLAQLLEKTNRLQEAEKILVGMVAEWPTVERYRIWRTRLALARKDFVSAATAIQEARERGMASHQWHLLQAQLYRLENQTSAALTETLECLKNLQSEQAVAFAARLLLEEGFSDEAETVLDKFSGHEIGWEMHLARAMVAKAKGRQKELTSHLLQAIKSFDGEESPFFDRLRSMLPASALSRLASEMVRIPDVAVDRYLLVARYASHIGAYREALVLAREFCDKVDEDNPLYPTAQATLASCYQHTDQPVKAARVYARLIDREPGMSNIRASLAYLYATRLNEPEKAEELALAAMSGDDHPNPTMAKHLDTLALARMALGKLDQAEENLVDAMRLVDNPEIKAHYAMLLHAGGNIMAARKSLHAAWEQVVSGDHSGHEAETVLGIFRTLRAPVDSAMTLAVAEKYAAEGRREKAIMYLDQVSGAAVRSPEAAIEQAEVRLMIGDKPGAEETLRLAFSALKEPDDLVRIARFATESNLAAGDRMFAQLTLRTSADSALLAAARRMLEQKKYRDAKEIYERLVPGTDSTAIVFGYLMARLALDLPALPESWPEQNDFADLELSPGCKLLLAVMRGELAKVIEHSRYVSVDAQIRPADLVAVGRYIMDKHGQQGVKAATTIAIKAKEMAPDSRPVLVFSAQVWETAGRLDEAVRDMEKVVATFPLDTTAIRSLGRLYTRSKKADRLNALLSRYELLYSATSWHHSLRGEGALMQGQMSHATAAFQTAFELKPDPESLARLIGHMLRTDQFTKARDLLTANQDRVAQSAILTALQSHVSFTMGDTAEGIAYAVQAVSHLPADPNEACRDVFDPIVQACPPTAVVRLLAGFAKAEIRNTRIEIFLDTYFAPGRSVDLQGLEKLYEAAEANPDLRRRSGLLLGALLAENRSEAEALVLHADLARQFPASPAVMERYANAILQWGGGAADASRFAARAVELAETTDKPAIRSLCYETLGRIQLKLGLLTLAHQSLAMSVEQEARPSNLFALAGILAEKGVWLEAGRELERALELAGRRATPLPRKAVDQLQDKIKMRTVSIIPGDRQQY